MGDINSIIEKYSKGIFFVDRIRLEQLFNNEDIDYINMSTVLKNNQSRISTMNSAFRMQPKLFIVTCKRMLLYYKNKLSPETVESIPFNEIRKFEYIKDLFFNVVVIRIYTINTTYDIQFKILEKDHLDYVVDLFNKAISYKSESVKSVSNADELREFKKLLDDGIITQSEFDKKKESLLK